MDTSVVIHQKHSHQHLRSPPRNVLFFSCRSDSYLDRQCSDHGQNLYTLQPFLKKNDSFKFRIILASEPNANSTWAKFARCQWHEILPYLFTNNAFVFKPFNESPRHLNQNRSSSFFKLAGSLPASEEPGVSSSVKALAAIRDDQNKQRKATLRTD